MRASAPTLSVILVLPLVLSGCLGFDAFGAKDYDPMDFEPTGRTVELRAFVSDVKQELWPGFEARFWAFCIQPKAGSEDAVEYQSHGEPCSTPGPTVRVKQGDLVRVEFTNGHRFAHTIHWHGQVLPHEMDGVPGATQDTTETGDKYVYEFIAARPGTLWYHCHVDTQRHVFRGLYGTFIVEPQDDRFEPEVDKDYTLVLSHGNRSMMDARNPEFKHDPNRSGHVNEQNDPFNVEYDIFMINGQSFPNTVRDPLTRIDVKEGEKVRIRLVNAGQLGESIHLHGHDMRVTHKDGLPLSAPYWVDTLAILPGERYDVLVTADNPGKWVMHTHITPHVTNGHVYPGGMLTQLVYEGYEDKSYRKEAPATPTERVAPPSSGGTGGNGTTPAAPDDFEATHSDNVTSASYARAYAFDVKDAPAVEARATLTFESAVPTSEVTLTVTGPDGSEVGTQTASANGATVEVVVPEPAAGKYAVDVTGRGVSARYTLTLTVDYAGNDA